MQSQPADDDADDENDDDDDEQEDDVGAHAQDNYANGCDFQH